MQSFIVNDGIIAVFLLMTLESMMIPIPSELIMTFAGYLVATTKLSFVGVVLAGSLGNLVGSYLGWIIGRYIGRAALLNLGKYVWLKEEDLDRAERWFERRGEFAVFFSRLLPVVRTFISVPAGAAEMNLVKFGIFTFLGCLPFTLALTWAGYAVGANYHKVVKDVQYGGYVIALVAIVFIAGFFFKRYRARQAPTGSV